LMKVLNSIIDNWSDDFIVLIGDQNKVEDYSDEKKMFYRTVCAYAHTAMPGDCFKVVQLPFDCGLSFARNKLVETAHELGIKYCLIGADSIKFTESMKDMGDLTRFLNYKKDLNIDLIGFELRDRIGWEAKLDLKDSFVLDFIDKTEPPDRRYGIVDPSKLIEDETVHITLNIYYCDIVRNFFLATTKSLLKVKWDNNLKLAEHCEFFWRYKQAGYKVGWTDVCQGQYITCDDLEYKKLRRINMMKSKEILKRKLNLTTMYKYINLKNTNIKGK